MATGGMEADGERRSTAEAAAVWGLPLVMMARYLAVAEGGAVPFNRLFVSSGTASPGSAAVGPNIDTLNGRAWLDLDGGPVVLEVPDSGGRYYSVQFQDMYMNSFAYVGRRTTGTAAGAFVVTPPGYAGPLPPELPRIAATTSRILLFVRTLVGEELAAAQAINRGFTLGSLSGYPAGQAPASMSETALDAFQPASRRASRLLPHEEIAQAGAGFFDELAHLVRRFPPLPADADNLARFAPLLAGGGRSPEEEEMLGAAVAAAVATAQRALRTWPVNGWMRRDNVPAFIADPVQRAANNLYGPNTQVAEESVFFNLRKGPDDAPLHGSNRYRLRFPAGALPPVDAFWSLTLYDGSYSLFANPIDRYGIGDRTAGLRFGDDGALDIRIQSQLPDDPLHNWLPAPPDGFQLILRTYQPQAAILDGSWAPPPLEIVAAD